MNRDMVLVTCLRELAFSKRREKSIYYSESQMTLYNNTSSLVLYA